ncbi:hypothetical protein RJ640_014552 [Escallonia rubra]|uniref:Uncharacterized protein n=1 Tax=Escallonia rubra TaxID=112253 RepID=A0AA88R8J3_9ASTE|nr:hypothetical protein RJ640_014552 [Escallonia rubra]
MGFMKAKEMFIERFPDMPLDDFVMPAVVSPSGKTTMPSEAGDAAASYLLGEGQGGPIEKFSTVSVWPSESRNGHTNGYINVESSSDFSDKGRGEGDRIEMLRMEVGELKEVIEGKEYLLQNYKEQKSELSMRVKELQQRLDSQLPNIL